MPTLQRSSGFERVDPGGPRCVEYSRDDEGHVGHEKPLATLMVDSGEPPRTTAQVLEALN